jgi:hypothetical protein
MRAAGGRRRALPVLLAALALAASALTGVLTGCELTEGDTETVTVTVTEKTKTEKKKSEQDRSGEDSAANDIPPPAGSPAAKFEQYCRDHPAACD